MLCWLSWLRGCGAAECRLLLKQMLTVDPKQRITIKAIRKVAAVPSLCHFSVDRTDTPRLLLCLVMSEAARVSAFPCACLELSHLCGGTESVLYACSAKGLLGQPYHSDV